jgi:hypothetical protein
MIIIDRDTFSFTILSNKETFLSVVVLSGAMNCRMNVFTLLTNVCFTVETPELDVLSFHKVKKASEYIVC